MNDRLNMIVVPTEVIWKWQEYGNNFTANNPVAGSWNQSDI